MVVDTRVGGCDVCHKIPCAPCLYSRRIGHRAPTLVCGELLQAAAANGSSIDEAVTNGWIIRNSRSSEGNMDPKAQAKAIHQEVSDQIGALLFGGGERISPNSFEFRRLLTECDRVQKAFAVQGSVLKARLYAAAGDRAGVFHWLDNVVKNGAPDRAAVAKFFALLVLGDVRDANAIVIEAFNARGDTPAHEFLRHACNAGLFQKVEQMVRICRDQSLVHKGVSALEIAPRAARILESHAFTEEMMIDVMTELHAVLREENTIWYGNAPSISFHDEGQPHQYVRISFQVAFDADKTAEMSWRLTERLVAKGLDAPGLIVSFAPADVAAKKEAPDLIEA
jgi:hypothetical protein